jgi:hypothetical protein
MTPQPPITLGTIATVCADEDGFIDALAEWNLIPRPGEYLCRNCGGLLHINRDASRTDGFRWHCHNSISPSKQKRRQCGYHVELRTGTFFAKSKLTIKQVGMFGGFIG